MPKTIDESKLLSVTVNSLLILAGIVIITSLLSIRSWYKRELELGQVSPFTIKLEKDREVIDTLKTLEKKEEAKHNAILNSRNRQILQVDNESTAESIENLKFLIEICQEEINPLGVKESVQINPKVSLKTQELARGLSDGSWEEFEKLTKMLPESLDRDTFTDALNELNEALELDRNMFLEAMKAIREKDKKAKAAKETLGRSFFNDLKNNNPNFVFSKAKEVQKRILDLGIVNGLSKDKIKSNVKILYPELSRTNLSLIQKLILRSTVANVRIDWKKVLELEEEAMQDVPDMRTLLKKGALLAEKGKKISTANYHYLEQLKKLSPPADREQIFYNFILISLCVGLLAVFFGVSKLKRFSHKEIIMLIIVTSGLAATLALISLWGINKLVITPFAALSMLLTSVYAPIMAATLSTLMGFFLLESFDLNIWQVLPLYAGSIYAIFLTRKAHQREDLTKAGTKIAIFQVLIFVVITLLAAQEFKVVTVLIVAAFYAISGIISGVLTLAILPYLESTFGLLTPFRLIELSNPNQPLLKKLREEAPGTYQHSLNIVQLAEEACRAIGGNLELTRIGILYHDIGKTYKPDYFIENQFGNPNPHTTLDDPEESAKIIIAHVPEGVKLAKKYNLPQAIIDFIPMHQGTAVTGYFYHKAFEKYGEASVDIENYKYPGPKPNTKETGIAMIADSVEALMTSMKEERDEEEIKKKIAEITQARLDEGELEESGLSLEELEKIQKAFLKVWRSKNHERVKYPEKKGKDESPESKPAN